MGIRIRPFFIALALTGLLAVSCFGGSDRFVDARSALVAKDALGADWVDGGGTVTDYEEVTSLWATCGTERGDPPGGHFRKDSATVSQTNYVLADPDVVRCLEGIRDRELRGIANTVSSLPLPGSCPRNTLVLESKTNSGGDVLRIFIPAEVGIVSHLGLGGAAAYEPEASRIIDLACKKLSVLDR